MIQCAHGDTVLYPITKVQMTVDGKVIDVKAAASEMILMDVLLGKDVSQFYELLNGACSQKQS